MERLLLTQPEADDGIGSAWVVAWVSRFLDDFGAGGAVECPYFPGENAASALPPSLILRMGHCSLGWRGLGSGLPLVLLSGSTDLGQSGGHILSSCHKTNKQKTNMGSWVQGRSVFSPKA